MEFLKTYTWQNALRGGALRDVYALLYQLEHNAKRKNPLQVSITYIAERLGYSERSVRNAISELKETGWLEVEYTDGRRSVFRTLTPADIAAPTPANSAAPDPCKICRPAKSAPLQDLPPSPAEFAAPTPYLISKDSLEDIYSSSSSSENAREGVQEKAKEQLQKWFAESDLREWVQMLISRSGVTDLSPTDLLSEFYDNDFSVREECEQSERTAVLKHFQNWLPKYLRKLKTENDHADPYATTQPSAAGATAGASRAAQTRRSAADLNDIARSIAAGFAAGAARRGAN